MTAKGISRRRFLGSAALATTMPLTSLAGTHARRTLDLNDPQDNLTAMIKMRGSLEAVDVPFWYFGTIYAVLPGKAPVALVEYEGSEIDYYERQDDGTYKANSATVSFFRDPKTRKRVDRLRNPITGKINEVRPNSITVKAHYIYSVDGAKRSDDPRPFSEVPPLIEKTKWTESGEHIWLNMNRPYPDGYPIGEDQTMRGLLRELHDPSMPKVYSTGNPTYMSPWLSWMDMADVEGYSVWAGPARKLDSVEQYPRELLDYLEKNFPEKLTAKPAAWV